jgi:pimeloyl-ACP methyl ester carboxylesterase
LHGYGRSAPLPQDGRPYFERDSRIVVDLAAKFGGPAHLVGHSIGGTVALHVVLKHPDLAASLFLIEPVQFSLLEESGAPEQAEFHEISTTTSALNRLNRSREAARIFVDFWVADGAFSAMDEKTQNYIAQTVGRISDDWAGVSLHAPGQMKIADLAGLSLPCQIIRGGATRPSARAISEILHAHISASDLHEIPDVGHMGAVIKPEPFNKIIVDFLNAQSAPDQKET